MDGASQSQITIEARDSNGQLLPNLALRTEILANGQFVDFGSLSARTTVTGSNGRASVAATRRRRRVRLDSPSSIFVTPSGSG